jgi:hypothetical protein
MALNQGKGGLMGKEVATLIDDNELIRALANKLHRDIERLQLAIIKESKHEIGSHLSNALERSWELTDMLNESSSASTFR